MSTVNGTLIKRLREDLNLTQEKFAQKISVSTRQLSRMENNESKVSMTEFVDMMQMFDMPTEHFMLLFLESKEYADYEKYSKMVEVYRTRKFDDFELHFPNIKSTSLYHNPYVQQLIAYIKLEMAGGMMAGPHFDSYDFDELYDIISITIKDFDEEKVADYLLTSVEMTILGHLCYALSNLNEHERAIKMANALIHNKSLSYSLNINDDFRSYPYLCNVLTMCLSNADRHDDALSSAISIYRYKLKKGIIYDISTYLNNLSYAHKLVSEDISVSKLYFLRCYYWALCMNSPYLPLLKQFAKEDYNLILDD